MLDIKKPVGTKNGLTVHGLVEVPIRHSRGNKTLFGFVEHKSGGITPFNWNTDGKSPLDLIQRQVQHDFQLVNKAEKRTVYLNFYEGGGVSAHYTEHNAAVDSDGPLASILVGNRVACIKMVVEFYEGQGLED